MNAMIQNMVDSLTGNLPKAILCVRDLSSVSEDDDMKSTARSAKELQKKLLKSTDAVLNGRTADLKIGSESFRSLTGANGAMAGSGYLALEVQYNPNTIYLDTQAGKQVQYSGGALGDGSNNQLTQIVHPVSTTMSFQLVFDDMNPSDAFMLEQVAPTLGNAVSGVSSIVTKKKGGYSVQAQIDGLMSLLTQDVTRQVIFYWARMCFRGELTSVNSRYTMFNKDGNPIRGVVDLTICQGNEAKYEYDETYWEEAFDHAFGDAFSDAISGKASKAAQAVKNNFLNINL